MTFDFIHDKKFRKILERDYEELNNCISIKASKSILILSGSIIEAILTDYFIEELPNGYSENDILKASLSDLLDLAENLNKISNKELQLGTIIKDYRNLIHPGKEIRKNEQFDFDSANLSKLLVDLIIKKLRNNHLQKYGYSSDEILDKLINDMEFHSIYGSVITKLDHNEREKLLEEFIRIEELFVSNFEYFKTLSEIDPISDLHSLNNLYEVKLKTQELKPLIKTETITEYLIKLKDSIIKGDSITTLTLYNLFHEELNQLPLEDQNLIAIYMLSLFESIFEDSRELATDKTYSTIGKYLHNDKAKEQLISLCHFSVVHFGGASAINSEMDVFQQIFNSLPPNIQSELKMNLDNFLPGNRTELENSGLHFFYDEAVKRNIINAKYDSLQ